MSIKARKRVNRVMRDRVTATRYTRQHLGAFSFSPHRREQLDSVEWESPNLEIREMLRDFWRYNNK